MVALYRTDLRRCYSTRHSEFNGCLSTPYRGHRFLAHCSDRPPPSAGLASPSSVGMA